MRPRASEIHWFHIPFSPFLLSATDAAYRQDSENVVILLQAASLFHAGRLRSSCLEYILQFYAALESEGMLSQLNEDVLGELQILRDNMKPST